jgi:rhodanese-related sulfurtransferase
MPREEFVKLVASDQPSVPAYFALSAEQNLRGSASLDTLEKPRMLETNEIESFDGVVIDVRKNTDFGAGHLKNAINIGLGGQFASWAGTLIPVGTPIAIFANTPDEIDEAVVRLARVGHETVKGAILSEDFKGEKKIIEQVPVEGVREILTSGEDIQFVDVRRPAEHNAGHAIKTVNIPLDELPKEFERLDPTKPTYVICQSGYRSSAATSVLENAGFEKVYNVTGGTAAWIEKGLETEAAATACAIQ